MDFRIGPAGDAGFVGRPGFVTDEIAAVVVRIVIRVREIQPVLPDLQRLREEVNPGIVRTGNRPAVGVEKDLAVAGARRGNP